MARNRQPKNDYIQPMLEVGPFGGIDTTTEAYYVPQTNFTQMMNLVPNSGYGGFVTAKGRLPFLSAPLPGQCRGFHRFARANQPDVYVFAVDIGLESGTGALYYALPGGVPQALVLPAGVTLTFGAQYSFATDQQWLFLVNGVDTPLKVDQNLIVTRWGIVAPVTTPNLLAAGASTMVGQYYYSITFGNAAQESSQGVVSLPIIVTNQGVALTAIPVSTDTQVTQRNIYRLGGAIGQWRLVGTINDNTTTTYIDNTADTAVGHILTVFRDPPPIFKAITSHKERIWGFGTENNPAIVYYSNLGEPYAFNEETGNLPVGENSQNDQAIGLASTGSVLGLMKSESFHAVFGDTDSNFISNQIADVGCTNLNSIWQGGGVCGWMSHQGSYLWDGSSAAQNISDGKFQQSNIKGFLDGLSDTDFALTTSFYYDRMIHHSFPTLNRTYFYDLRTNNWFVLGWALDQVYYRPESESYKVLGTNLEAPGDINTWFAAPGDFGGAIEAYGITGITDSGSLPATKVYRYVLIEAPPQDALLSILTIVNPGAEAFNDVQAISMATAGPKYQFSLPESHKGFQVQVKILIKSASTIHIQKVGVYGWIERMFTELG